jgi:hypothetical protein
VANKLKWFTHDNDAHMDAFIDAAISKFGHFGYAGYFMILEILHREGVGDVLMIPLPRLSKLLRSKPAAVRQYLAYCSAAGKMMVTYCGDAAEIKINKFLQRQRKLRFNSSSTVPQQFPNRPQQREGEGQRHTDDVSVPPKPTDHGLGMPYSGVVLQFWSAYPPSRRSDKRECQYEWDQAKIDKPEVVLEGLERLKESEDWKKDNGRWVPSSTKFLRRRMWEKTEGENGRKLNPRQFA